MRAAKVPGVGFSVEVHSATPPSLPPVPPSPVNPALVPAQPWLHFIVNPIMGLVLTGKWSHQSVATEGMATILWQHDWGPLQPHKIIPAPVIKTPSTLLLLVGSSAKYYLPSFSVKQRIDGAIGSGAQPVAICFPAYLIVVQTCADIATKSFYQPVPGFCLQNMSTRWVGFSKGDLYAGMIGFVGDCLAALTLSHFGGKLFSVSATISCSADWATISSQVGLQLAGPVHVGSVFGSVFVGTQYGEGAVSSGTAQGIAGVLLAPVISWLGGQAATAVGDDSGSKPGDADPSWEQDPRPAPPAPAPAPPATGDAGTDAPSGSATPPASSSSADAGTPPSSSAPPEGPPADPPASSSSGDQSGGTSSADADGSSGGVCEPPPPWL